MSTRRLAWWIALVGSAEIGLRGHLSDSPALFHAGAWLLALVLAGTAWRRRGRAGARLLGAAAALPAALSALAWAGIPPATPNPLADYWEAHRLEHRVLSTIVSRGPVRLFGQEIPLDHRGFRLDPDRPNPLRAFRIVIVGGSTTFGATRTPEEQPWPTLLQQRIDALECETPVVVVNAGRVGRALGGSIQDFDREIRQLGPDLIVHYPSPQDIAGLLDEVPDDVAPESVVPPRASALLRRLERAWRSRGVERRFRAAIRDEPAPLDLDAVPLTSTYRRFLLDMRRGGIDVMLATGSLAVDGESPESRIRLHEELDPRTRRLVLANRFHARFVRGLAAIYRAGLVDTRPGLDGCDEDCFLDLFHLTQAGREKLAESVFEALLPRLRREEPGCEAPASAARGRSAAAGDDAP